MTYPFIIASRWLLLYPSAMLESRRDLNKFYFYAPLILFMITRLASFIWVLPNWSDIALYRHYADSILAGQTPYFDFQVEYPPMTLIFFVIPGFIAKLLGGYEIIYRLQMALFDLGCLALIGPVSHHIFKADRRGIFIARLLYIALGAVSFQFLLDRFDIAVTFLIMLSIYLACVKEKWRVAYIMLWAAVLVKLFPAILFPFYIMLQYRLSKNAKKPVVDFGLSLGLAILVLIAFQAMFGDWWQGVTAYHGKRGIQVESLYASIILIARSLGVPAALNHEFGAYQLSNPFSAYLARAALFFITASMLLLYYGYNQLTSAAMDIARRKQALIKAILASLLIFIIFNKVLSPQYLLWVFPLAAVTYSGRNTISPTMLILVLATLATAILFPYRYVSLLTLQSAGLILLNTRNALLLILGILAVINLFYRKRAAVKNASKRPAGSVRGEVQ